MNSREALVFLPVKAGNDRIARHEGGQGATIQFVAENSQIFRIGANIALLKEDSPFLQEALGLDTRTATRFRVEMNLHAPMFPKSRLDSLVSEGLAQVQSNLESGFFFVQTGFSCLAGQNFAHS
jgi:hypothetical protein